jgi:hypothetical protein
VKRCNRQFLSRFFELRVENGDAGWGAFGVVHRRSEMIAMQLNFKPLLGSLVVPIAGSLFAQDLPPRAYVITPVDSSAIILTWSYHDGAIVSSYRSFRLFGRIPVLHHLSRCR